MQDLLQQIDPDYYRSARLLMVRAELEQLRQGRSAFVDVERRSRSPDSCSQLLVRAAIVQSLFARSEYQRLRVRSHWISTAPECPARLTVEQTGAADREAADLRKLSLLIWRDGSPIACN
jgi:hypothetical protein